MYLCRARRASAFASCQRSGIFLKYPARLSKKRELPLRTDFARLLFALLSLLYFAEVDFGRKRLTCATDRSIVGCSLRKAQPNDVPTSPLRPSGIV